MTIELSLADKLRIDMVNQVKSKTRKRELRLAGLSPLTARGKADRVRNSCEPFKKAPSVLNVKPSPAAAKAKREAERERDLRIHFERVAKRQSLLVKRQSFKIKELNKQLFGRS